MTESKRVLVVDDDEQVLFMMEAALQKLSSWCGVCLAHNGLEALEALQQASCDLVITDLRMPGMDGLELTEMIRASGSSTIVIWITAFRSPETDAAAQRLGVYSCLDKPVRVGQVRHIVPEALGIGRPPARSGG